MDLVAGRSIAAERRPIRHLDPVLLLVALLLSLVGLVMVYSATHQSLVALDLDPYTFVKRQALALALGTAGVAVVATLDYRLAKVYAGLVYAGLALLLVLVQTPLGVTTAGAQRWFELAGFQLTPSEFMKVGLIVMLAAMLSEVRRDELGLEDVVRATIVAALPMLLVFVQPDVGTTIVLAAILVGILVVAGARLRHLGLLALSALLLLFAAFRVGAVKEYQLARITAYLDPRNAPAAALYNREQAEIAIGSGGLTGRGFLRGTQTNLDFVPEQHTDFIFTVVGEEFGFVGSVTVLALFALLIWRAVRVAFLSKDLFGTYVAAGIASMFALQMFVNIGMVVGIMPITGIPLPFVSYGGSSLLANFLAVGLLLNVHMRRFT
ncbi:MAG TPA: rod shape-determining protein RodA [Actinomycetota bacterium]|nr:rod shape-determining protein RodA [Actinomycetota bacterium]